MTFLFENCREQIYAIGIVFIDFIEKKSTHHVFLLIDQRTSTNPIGPVASVTKIFIAS